jgi:hypothetical protein
MSRAARIGGLRLALAAGLTMLPRSGHAVCSVLDNQPCAPTFCGVFDGGPCQPDFPYPFGDGLRVNVQSPAQAAAHAPDKKLNTIQELFAALRACWDPPPMDEGKPGTQITIRFSLNRAGGIIGEPRYTYSTPALAPEVKSAYQRNIMATLRRCTPFPLSAGLGGAIAGRPISARFIDDRGLRPTGESR